MKHTAANIMSFVCVFSALAGNGFAQSQSQCIAIREGVINIAESKGLMIEAYAKLSQKRLIYPIVEGNEYAALEQSDYKVFEQEMRRALDHGDSSKEQALIRVLNELCAPLSP